MKKLNKTVSKILFSGILLSLLLLVGSCENWMSNDNFMEQIESEVHDANAAQVSVYVRNASTKMGSTEPSGNVTMKVDVASKISTIPSEDYGFFKWAAFSTNDFPTNKQHNNLTFISEEDYNENYKSKELPSSIVHFANPKSATTEVKILSSRSDIFIVPIVTERPSYVQSIPAEGEKNVVLNTSIRILFSKPIDENTLHDEEGFLNYSITSSSSSGGMGDDDSDLEIKDITDLFDYKLNSSGKMLSLTLKENIDKNGIKVKELLDPRQTISINLLEGICDRYGYAMKGNYKFNFKTGVDSDSIAPYIDILVGGTGDICDVFVSFHNEEKWNGKATEAAKKAPKDINSSEYDDKLLAQRVYDKINLYVRAEDIIGTDDTDVDIGTNTDEDNVNYVVIEASLMVDSDGKPVTVDTSIPKKNIMYIPGTLDSKSGINKLFSEIVPLGENGKRRKDGTIFSYDVSSLPDGLIKINVWAIDMTGNSGGPNDLGAPNIAKHDNGYKSIFVVKDTTPIDSAEVKKNKKVISNSERAPYFWYNNETIKKMELFDSLENKIQDKGHAKLRSLDKNLWWTFRVGNTSEKVLANDSSWQRIHDGENGNTSLHYSLNNAKAPSKDGPIDITLYLKDDLGNLSEPVLLDSIMYDNTAPTVSLKAGIGDFVNAKGEAVLHYSDDQVISQILKVDIGETNNDEAGSGIRRMEIHVTKDGNEVAEPLDPTNFKVKYAPSSIAEPKPTSEGIRDIAIDADDIASTANIKVFNVTDTNKITDGTLFIYGIKLGDADGTYQISIDLYDSALNKTPETDLKLHRGATTNFARDTTDPVINKVQIAGAVSRVAYSESEASWWMPIENQDIETLSRITIKLDISETGSGIKYIKLGKNIEFTSETKIKYGSTYLVKDKEYTLDVANRTIELKDWFTPILKDAKAKAITLENVKLNNPDKTEGNKIAIIADDFVEKSSGEKTEFFYNDTTSGTVIYADTKKPEITTLKIEDAAKKTATNPHSLGYDSKYTDSQNVTLTLKLTAESLHNGSGVKTITLSENALFTDDTAISVDDTELTSGITYSSSKDSVTFEKPFVADNVLTFTNVHIISAEEGKQTIKAYLTDFVGLENTPTESTAVTLDQVAPVITNIEWDAPAGIAKGSANSNEVTDQTFKVDFKEETSGARVIKFDIEYLGDAEGTPSYDKPFDLNNFELRYGSTLLNKSTDYNIKNDRYIELTSPKVASAGTFNFKNLKLRDTSAEGKYKIKVTLLDQAENINWNENTPESAYSKNIFIDTTNPVVTKVKVSGAEKREVYGNAADAKQWWMPYSKFASDGTLSNVDFEINVKEAGSGLKVLKLSEDVEFTAATKLKVENTYLTKDTDYKLNTEANTITLLNFEEPKLLGIPATDTSAEQPVVFTLENIKLKNINSEEGNKVGFEVEDWVTNTGSNENKVYYDATTFGNYIYADSEKPEVASLHIEDSAAETTNNPHSISYDKDHYTDTQFVKLTLKLEKENTHNGSGVKKVHLTQNAQFTADTAITVNGTPLTTGYDFKDNNTTVEFNQVFTEDETLVFTNVKILSTTDGEQKITTDLTDFVGLTTEVSTESNALTLDKTAPVISNIEWVADDPATTTIGFAKNYEVTDQTLKVDFTEATAGANIIKFDVIYNDETTSYATPFDMSDISIKYINGTETKTLSKADGDYTILDTNQRYIKLNEKYTSGTFEIKNIRLRNSENNEYDEGNYVVKVTLLDAAENKGENHESITIDATAPVIDGYISIPDLSDTVPALKYVEELTTSTGITSYDGYWLAKNYVGGSGSGQSANSIPLHINVKEGGSGIKVIKFLEDAVLTTSTKVCYIDGSRGKQDLPASKYTVANNTITINTKDPVDDANATNAANYYFSTKDGKTPTNSFLIIVENVGFKNTDTGSKVSKNTIKVQVSDVAKNESNEAITEHVDIYSDSIKPAAPNSFVIKDRKSSNGEGTISANSHYTNESVITLNFELSDSEKCGSGYHKFKIRGATFKASGTDATTLSMVTQSGSYNIENRDFDISEDGRTLTLKKSGANADTYAVVKQAVKITINNVHLDNPQNQGLKEVYLSAEDLTGWSSTEVSNYIYLDTEGPKFDNNYGPIFVANYTYSDYYKPAINVYPHVSSYTEASHGEMLTVSGKKVSAVYTATSYETTGVSLNKGEVSLTSGASYGAVLGIRATDNIRLRGYGSSNWFLKYVKYSNSENPFTKTTAAEILSTSSVKSLSKSECVTKPTASTTNNPDSETSCSYWFKFLEGKYSAVIFDDAGNCSDVFHFAVVKDISRPDTTDFANRQIIESPDESYSIYRNADASTTSFVSGSSTTSYNYANWNSGTVTRAPIRTVKFVTKKADKKFKLYLKLGGTSTSDHKYLDGSLATTTTSAYENVTASLTDSPIEKYAISTWYGAWPTADDSESDVNESQIAYEPAVPKFTTFPGGGTLDASGNYNTDPSAQLVGSYFNYTSTTATWRVEGGYNEWHSFTPTTPASDNQKNKDTGNEIYSYVDSNKNLVIEVPNTRSTPPITVFLRDGCGNMSYVVLGYKDSDKVAASFDFDDKLGKITTDNGVVKTPQIVQNPHLTYTTGTTNYTTWNGYRYSWNNQSGNGNEDDADKKNGVGETFGFMKDKTKNATYYNTNIYADTDNIIKTYTSSYSYKKPKLALTLQYSGNRESVLFSSGTKYAITNPDKDAPANSANDYTCRALLYISRISSVPDYDTIIKSKVLGTTLGTADKNKDGYRTNWVGVKTPTSDDQATVILDYPEPDYTALDWTVNTANHEPIPYYIWYIFEDRVGNYEIGKVVNSNVMGAYLNTSTRQGFDMWLYDGEAPEVTIYGTNGTKPDEIGNTQTNVEKLISDNNGYVPYLQGTNTVWISSDPSRGARHSSLIKAPATSTWGVTNKVENEANGELATEREYLPFANLTVSKEITGIKAFCWSTNATAPAYDTCASTNNTQGDGSANGKWYAGSGTDVNGTTRIPATQYDVGWAYTYKNATNTYLPYGAGNTYAGKYTGTKINEVLPYDIINKNPGCALYLYVMDWTGNIAKYRMGSNLVFKNDTTTPAYNASSDTNTVKNEWYVDYTDRFHIRIAGNGKGSDKDPPDGQKTMQIEFPESYFTDVSGAGIKGYHYYNASTNSYPTLNVAKGYLELPYSVYKNWGDSVDGTSFKVYVFDNVGNYSQFNLYGILDKTPPAVDTVSLVTEASSGTLFADSQKVYNTSSDSVTGYGYCHGFDKPAQYHADNNIPADELQEVWINKTGTAKFHINLTSNPGDLDDIRINKWNTNKWDTISSYKDNSTDWSAENTNSDCLNYYMGGYNKLTFASGGTYYQIEVLDKSGNATYRYFKIYLDNEAPVLSKDSSGNTIKPVITLGKGSINAVGTDYYYTADASHPLKLKFAVTDGQNGVGSNENLKKIKYSLNGTTWLPANKWIEDPSDIEIEISSGDIETLYFQDILENKTEVALKPGFSYTYTNGAGQTGTKDDISKLNFYSSETTNAPATPVIKKVKQQDGTELEWFATWKPGDGATWYINYNRWLNTDTVLITSKDRQKFQIQFDKPDTVIGYLVTDEKGNVVPETEYKIEKDGNNNDIYVQYLKEDSVVSKQYKNVKDWYSSASLDEGFTENLPMVKDGSLNSNYDYVTRKYYAVDVVGNISKTPLTIKYSYDDPTRAKNITLIESTDAITDKDGELDTDVLDLMKADDLVTKVEKVENGVTKYIYSPKKFAKFAKKKGKNNDKNGNIYFNDDFIVLRCTLLEKAVEGYNERPVKVNLYDVYTWAGNLYQTPRGSSAVSTDNDYNDMFKVYPSDKQDADGNYYCYIAFKIMGSFDNNTSSGGSVIYAKIYGKTQAESDYEYLEAQGITKDKKYGWQMDTTGPEFDSNVIYSNVLNSYVLKDYKTEGTWEKVYDRANDEKKDYATVAYKSGMKIGIQKIKDSGAGAAAYKFEIVNGSTTTYDGPHDLEPPKNISGTDYYMFKIPDISTTHTSLNLYLIDKVGNVSSKYVVASPNDTGDQWWILNDILKNAPNTVENPIRVTAKKAYTEAGPYPFLIEPPAGSIIRTIEVHLEYPNGEKSKESTGMPTNDFKEKENGNDVYYKRVDFVDYQDNNLLASGGKWSEGTKLSDNSIKGWVNINGFDFKVRSATKLWLPQTVVLTINKGREDEKVVKVKDWVPAFSLDLSKITWGNLACENSRYELLLTLPTEVIKDKNGNITQTLYATEDNICYELVKDAEDTFLSNVESSIETPDSTKPNEVKIVISGVPSAKDWKDHSISIKVWDKYDPNANPTTVTKEVLKINPIGAEDIDIKLLADENTEEALEWDKVTTYGEDRTKTFNIRIKTPGNAEISKLRATTDSDVNNVSMEWTSGNEAKITANPNWNATKVTFIINEDENNENGLTKTEYFTVPAITKDDFDISIDAWDTVTDDDDGTKSLPLNFTFPKVIGDLDPGTTTVEPGEFINTPAGMKLKVSQSWDTITSVKFTINGVEKPVAYTIPAKLLGDGDIEVSAGSWNSENTEYTFSLDFPENNSMKASMSNVKSVSLENPDLATLTPIEENPGTYKLTGFAEKTWNEQPINLIIKNTADTALTAMRVIAIQPKSLSKNDIQSVGGETLPEWDGTSQSYEVSISLTEGVPPNALKDVSATEEGVNAAFNDEKTAIILTGMQKGWSDKTVTVKINNSEALSYEVLKILKKSIGKDDVTITRAANNNADGKWYYCELTISLPLEVTIDTDGITSLTYEVQDGEETKTVNYVKTITVRKDENVTDKNVYIVGLQPDNGELSTGEIIQVKTSHGTFKVTAITSDENSGSPSTNLNLRGLGSKFTSFVKDLVSGSSEAYTEKNVSAYSYSDPVIVIDESVSVLARDIADVLAEQETLAKKEAKKATKAAKKAKKAQKAAAAKVEKAPVEKPVVTETVETVAVTSAAAVSEVVETVTETVANADTVATVEEAAPEAKVSMTAVDASVTERVADDQAQSDAILWLALAALCAAVVGIVVLFLKNRAAKK